jgi:uncharacterized membrane-anchored protein YhcB (DUF1043 family)
MIKFFRKIRYDLLGGNLPTGQAGKTGKYFKYAIGEIVLVVIGILIALSINNWNEVRISQAKFDQNLKKVHKELILNLNNTASAINEYSQDNQQLYNVLNKKVTIDDYKKEGSGLTNLIMGWETVDLSDDAANNLEGFSAQLNDKQDTLLSRINLLYNYWKGPLNRWDDEMDETIKAHHNRLKIDTDWYYILGTGDNLPEAAYTYFLTDPNYLNDVYQHVETAYNNQLSIIYQFNREAKVLYQDLTAYLEMEVDTTIIKPVKDLRHYIGTYKLINNKQEESFVIKERQGQLTYSWTNKSISWLNENGADIYSFFPSTNDEFMIGHRFGKLIRNENNEVTGFIRSLGGLQPKEYEKVDSD